MRATLKTPDVLDAICARIADGESLRTICESEGMPKRRTVLDWLESDEAFRAKYARAREAQADVMDEKILETAEAATPENAAAARVKIDAFKWRASKLKPKVYGDKVALTGDEENPIHTRNTQVIDTGNLSIAALREIARLAAPDNG